MELLLQRAAPDGPKTRGRLSNNAVFIAFTLEPTALMIPAGRYQVVTFVSPHFDRSVPRLLSVPGREAIEMHGGNTIKDSRGCILIGVQRTEQGICCCDEAISMTVRMIELARQRGERSYVTVVEGKA